MGLRIVIDEIGPREGLLDRGSIGIQLNPAGNGGMAQFPAGSPAQASAGGQSPPLERPRRDINGGVKLRFNFDRNALLRKG